MFHSIFSKKKGKPKEKPVIIADNREKNSLVIAELVALDIDVEFKQLEIADYLIGETAVERKTASDLIGSMLNKRIFSQIENLKQYEKSLIIIEGYHDLDLEESQLNENAVKGLILSISLEHRIPIIFSKDAKDTALLLSLITKKKKTEFSLRAKIQMPDNQRLQFILEGFPNIGPVAAKKLLEKYKTIRNIILAPAEEISQMLGKKAEKFLELREKEYAEAPEKIKNSKEDAKVTQDENSTNLHTPGLEK